MPSQTRSSSRMSSATRRIQRSYRGFKSRKNLKRMKDNMLTGDCSVCLYPINHLTKKVAITLPCFHIFHRDCILNGLTSTDGRCPNCMRNVNNISFRRRQARAQPPPLPPPPLPPPQQLPVINMTNAQRQRAISGNPSPHLLHLQRRWAAQHQLDTAQRELTDYQNSGINDPQRERILNNRLRFATRELEDAMRNFTNG